jgi:hypothetical protein
MERWTITIRQQAETQREPDPIILVELEPVEYQRAVVKPALEPAANHI